MNDDLIKRSDALKILERKRIIFLESEQFQMSLGVLDAINEIKNMEATNGCNCCTKEK